MRIVAYPLLLLTMLGASALAQSESKARASTGEAPSTACAVALGCCGCSATLVSPPAAGAPTPTLVSIEAAIGLANGMVHLRADGDLLVGIEEDVGPLLSLTPAIEWPLGRVVHWGLEWTFASIDDPSLAEGRRTVGLPMVRARVSFTFLDDWTADGVFGLGAAIWSAGLDGSTLYGWSRRWAVGASYRLDADYAVFAQVGSVLMQAAPAAKGPLSDAYDRPQPVGLASVVLALGVRTAL